MNCPNCNKEMPEGMAFCSECGTSIPQPAPEPVFTPVQQEPVAPPVQEPIFTPVQPDPVVPVQPVYEPVTANPQPTYQQQTYGQQAYGQQTYQQQPNYYQAPPQQPPFYGEVPAKKETPVSTGSFLLMELAAFLPIIGLIIYIVLACGSKNANPNRTNYARGKLIYIAICTVIAVLFFYWAYNIYSDYMSYYYYFF